MLTAILVSLAVGILAGGFGGYRWGASVEKKAASTLGGIAGVAGQFSKKV